MRSYRVFYYSTSGMKIPSIGAFCYRIFYIFFQCPAGRRPGSGSPCVPPALCFWVIVAGMPGVSLCNEHIVGHVIFIALIHFYALSRKFIYYAKVITTNFSKLFIVQKQRTVRVLFLPHSPVPSPHKAIAPREGKRLVDHYSPFPPRAAPQSSAKKSRPAPKSRAV